MTDDYWIIFNLFRCFGCFTLITDILGKIITNIFDLFLFSIKQFIQDILVFWTNHDIKISCIELFHLVDLHYELIPICTHIAVIIVQNWPIKRIVDDNFTCKTLVKLLQFFILLFLTISSIFFYSFLILTLLNILSIVNVCV